MLWDEDLPPPPNDGLSDRNAAILRQFTDFLRSSETVFDTSGGEPQVGLYQLFEALAAQRHELKLYTKSGRQTQELLTDCIRETSAAVESLKRLTREKPEIERKAVDPYLTSLVEIDEAIQRAGTAMETLLRTLKEWSRSCIASSTTAYCDELSWWGRFWKRKIVRHFAASLFTQQEIEIEKILEPFRTGLELLQRRTDDVMQKHSIRRLAPWGEPVDPATMQVVAVVESQEIPPGHVVDVVRLGYTWQGLILRFADVRAAKTNF